MKFHCFYLVSALLVSAAAHASDAPVQFTDMRNRPIRLDNSPRRVVVLPIPAASMLVGMDENAGRLVGMHPFAKVAARDGMLGQMFPDVLNVRGDTVGNNFMPNIETLLNVQPDLVWQWGHRGDDIITPMENVGLKVATLNYGLEAYTQRWIQLMGLTLGKQEKAQAMNLWRNQVIGQLKQALGGLNEVEKPRVLYLSQFNNSIQTFGATSHNNFDIELAGGKSLNKTLSGARTLNIEQIIVWDPEVILLGNFEQGLKPQDVYDNPLLADVTAVRARRVFKLPIGGFIWDAPNQETPLYWQWLSMVLHPDKVRWPLRAEISQRYWQLYHYRPGQAQIDQILHIPHNRVSAYGAFLTDSAGATPDEQ